MKYTSHLASALLLITLFSCNNNTNNKDLPGDITIFFDKTGMDSTIKPGDNFFQYANGAWIKNTVIPDDKSRWGSFVSLYDENLKRLNGLLKDESKNTNTKGSLEQKVTDYYKSGMDTLAIEKTAAEPLKPTLAKIDAIKDYKDILALLPALLKTREAQLVGLYVAADEKNSTQNIAVLYQSGLSLPEKDYYFKTDSASAAARNGLLKYAAKLFTLTGEDTATAAKNANNILMLETEIAKSHRTPVELRNPQNNYNKMNVAQLQQLAPNIDWKNLFSSMSIQTDTINISQPGYYKALSALLVSRPVEYWKSKIKLDYISANTHLLSKAFTEAQFSFDQMFSGQKIDEDRWKKIVNMVDQNLGELLGQLYVKKYFTAAAKQRMDELVNNLQKAFEIRIKNLDWMSDSTKQKATAKLNTFLKKIGYPSKWKNYDDVTIDPNNLYANANSARAHHYKEMIAKIGKPVDRTEWGMTPPTVNAYYNPTNNEIVFPAGILQFPFFDANADDAINYGAIGMVIGHEMTHGFDDQGSQYDDKGNMQNWWGAADAEKFKSKTTNVINQYNAFTVLDSIHVKGELTLGENLADIGGLAIAYDAFKLTPQAKDTTKIDGFTPDQRFFLGFAQVWRMKLRDENARVRINTDPHSPAMYRVNGPVMNFDPFYTAFGIKESDKMYLKPQDRVKIW